MRKLLTVFLFISFVSGAACGGEMRPLTEDERAALHYLDFVARPKEKAIDKDVWGGWGWVRQFGLFANRYQIAFLGYAAAALGQRGNEEERKTVGKILGHCIRRMLKPRIWWYSQVESYWGRKPWAPDPCYRENLMYTGHLLQLLALYETFTGDTQYWTTGFDFRLKGKPIVHYDVQKLIDVTVGQMRTNDCHGVTCEPGLVFFPCNNHPHIAFRLFEKLGHGDWKADSAAWEKWALDHFLAPFFGGGAIKLVYHAPTGLFFPRGNPSLDAWSLLWYEPWAGDREAVRGLWKKAMEKVDFADFDDMKDEAPGMGQSCLSPASVPKTVLAAFLAAAARACGDAATADRLEKALDEKFLVRKDGMLYLDLNKEWRIGTTANRILSMAYANGSSFRELIRVGK